MARSAHYAPCPCTRCLQHNNTDGHCQCANCPECVRRAMLTATGSAAVDTADNADYHAAFDELLAGDPAALLSFISPRYGSEFSGPPIRWDAGPDEARALRRALSASLGNLIRDVREATRAEHGEPARAASQTAIDSLVAVPRRSMTPIDMPGDAEICPVCQCDCETECDHDDGQIIDQPTDEMASPEEISTTDVVSMPCGHNFHRECLLPWLRSHNSCPTCRFKLTPARSKLDAARERKASLHQLLARLESWDLLLEFLGSKVVIGDSMVMGSWAPAWNYWCLSLMPAFSVLELAISQNAQLIETEELRRSAEAAIAEIGEQAQAALAAYAAATTEPQEEEEQAQFDQAEQDDDDVDDSNDDDDDDDDDDSNDDDDEMEEESMELEHGLPGCEHDVLDGEMITMLMDVVSTGNNNNSSPSGATTTTAAGPPSANHISLGTPTTATPPVRVSAVAAATSGDSSSDGDDGGYDADREDDLGDAEATPVMSAVATTHEKEEQQVSTDSMATVMPDQKSRRRHRRRRSESLQETAIKRSIVKHRGSTNRGGGSHVSRKTGRAAASSRSCAESCSCQPARMSTALLASKADNTTDQDRASPKHTALARPITRRSGGGSSPRYLLRSRIAATVRSR